MTGAVIKRDELYEEVWSAAVRKVAKKYGISDVALAKICKKLNVPVPGLGYWARVAAGAKLDRTPLPPPKPGQPLEYRVEGRQDPLAHPEAGQEARALLEREDDPAMQEVVPAELTKPHPLIRASAPLLRRKRKKGERPLNEAACLDITAVGETLERALRVADTLLKALERRGFLIEVTRPIVTRDYYSGPQTKPSRTGVHLLGQFMEFGIEEDRDILKIEPKPEKPLKGSNWVYTPPVQYEHRPNGKLQLRIKNAFHVRQTWADGKTQQVENCLNSFIVGLIRAAERERLKKLEWERREREIEEERRRQQEEKERREHEARLDNDLRSRVSNWRHAHDIREFLAIVEDSARRRSLDVSQASQLGRWIAWARRRADMLETDAVMTVPGMPAVRNDKPA